MRVWSPVSPGELPRALDGPVVSGIDGPAVAPVLRGIVGASLLPEPTGTEVSSGMVGKVSRGADEDPVGEVPRLEEPTGTEEV